ncbi:MAG: ATP-binding protein [Vulcanimicrobiota bacterium]
MSTSDRGSDGVLRALLLDSEQSERAKKARDLRYNQVSVPAFRMVGLACLLLLSYIHNRYLLEQPAGPELIWLARIFVFYGSVSWLVLVLFYRTERRFHLGDFFLGLDVVVWSLALVVTGGAHSWLFFTLLSRVADQANTSFKRCLVFLQVVVMTYLLFLVALQVGGQSFGWLPQLARIAILYVVGFYISLTALAAERLRERARQVFRLGRQMVRQLESQNRELARAREEAESANRLKSGFLAVVTHELRTPLNAMMGYSDLLSQEVAGELNPKQRKYVDHCTAASARLDEMIGTILEYSKLEAEGLILDLEQVNVNHVLGEAVEDYRRRAIRAGLTLDFEAPQKPVLVWADPERLRQVLDILLDNAVKYTPDGGRVEVSLEDASILVGDTGPGIPACDQENVFRPFVQLKTGLDRPHDGVGLGLSLARALCKAQGGAVDLISPGPSGVGSCFVVRLAEVG